MMATRTKTSRKKRTNRDYIRGLAARRLELIFKGALEQQRYDIAFAAVMAQCRLHGLKIDGPGQPGDAPRVSPEIWEKLPIDSKRRRDN